MDIETYAMAKKYTDQKTSQTAGLHREIVYSLPVTGDENVIYMLPKTGSGTNNYDEYMWINNAYELIGNTEVDLTDYYNKTQVDTALSGKANTATTLAGYGITDAYTKTEVDDKIVVDSFNMSDSVTINAGDYEYIFIPCAKTGYKAVGVVGILSEGTEQLNLTIFKINSNIISTDVLLSYTNNTSSAQTISDLTVSVLFIKN